MGAADVVFNMQMDMLAWHASITVTPHVGKNDRKKVTPDALRGKRKRMTAEELTMASSGGLAALSKPKTVEEFHAQAKAMQDRLDRGYDD